MEVVPIRRPASARAEDGFVVGPRGDLSSRHDLPHGVSGAMETTSTSSVASGDSVTARLWGVGDTSSGSRDGAARQLGALR